MNPRRTPVALALFGALLLGGWAAEAAAGVVSGKRSNWAVGAGWNFGRGTFEDPAGERDSYQEGSSSQIRAGRMWGNHVQIGVDYQGWAIEAGVLEDSTGVKARRSLQNLSVTVTVFPGKPETAFGGLYLRAGAGLGWSGTGLKEVNIGEETHPGPRVDEWGTGFLAEIGYEFWVFRHFTIAPGLAFNYFELEAKPTEIVQGIDFPGVSRAGFAVFQITFNAYFGGE